MNRKIHRMGTVFKEAKTGLIVLLMDVNIVIYPFTVNTVDKDAGQSKCDLSFM